MTAAAEATEAPVTADEAEEHARELDRRRAAIAERYNEHHKNTLGGIDDHWTMIAQEITRAGLELDQKRGEAWKVAKRMREREASKNQWRASLEVMPEHRVICESVVAAADALVLALEAEESLHEQIRKATGASRLPDLNADLTELKRLRESARVIVETKAEKPRNGKDAP